MNIQQKKYILPSPAGAYYCITSPQSDPAKQFLQKLMTYNETQCSDPEVLNNLLSSNTHSQDEILFHIQELKWLQSFDQEKRIPEGTIEQLLPEILQQLSSDAKALLADDQGFFLSGSGFTHEASEELAALSGDILSLCTRHKGIIHGNLNVKTSAMALVDAAGHSQIGFWPLYIGELAFILVLSGVPRFDQYAFVKLVWILHKRYYSKNS